MSKQRKLIVGLSCVLGAAAVVVPVLTAMSCTHMREKYEKDLVLIEMGKGYSVAGVRRSDRANIKEIVVPQTIDGKPVVEIAKGAFKGCSNLEKITLPFIGHAADAKGVNGLFGYIFGNEMYEGCPAYTWQSWSTNDNYDVLPTEYSEAIIPSTLTSVTITGDTNIVPGAFSGCSYLQEINFTNSTNGMTTTEIGNFAFYNCKALKNFTIPSSIKIIGRAAFAGCKKMKELTLHENITTMKHNAFANCMSLYKLPIPISVQNMGKLVFANFNGLLLCETPSAPSTWDTEWVSKAACVVYNYHNGGIIYTADKIVAICGEGDKFASIIQLLGDNWKKAEVTIGGTVESEGAVYNIKHLGPNLFLDNDVVETLTISENIEMLGSNCFEGCTKLKTINLPESLKTIGTECFKNCNLLNDVKLPHVEEIGISAFEGITGLNTINFGDSLKAIDDSAFKNCVNLTPLRDTDNKTQHPLVFPKSLQSIGEYAFYNSCKFIPVDEEEKKLKSNIGDIQFEANTDGLELTIAESAFELAGVRSTSTEYKNSIYFYIDFNNRNIKKFSARAFKNCYLYGLYGFPQSIEEIEDEAFYESNPTYLNKDTTNESCRLLTIPKSVTKIGYRAFYDCYNCAFHFEDSDKPEASKLTTIGEQAFRYCSYNPAIDTNGYDIYYDAQGNKQYAHKIIYIPDSVTSCGSYAFGSNNGARRVHIPENSQFTRLESGMFSSCKFLGEDQIDKQKETFSTTTYTTYVNPVVVPENVTYVGGSVFSDCNLLKAVRIKGKINTLGSSAFLNCTSLENGASGLDSTYLYTIIFDDNLQNVTTFGSSIYQGCTNMIWAPWQEGGAGVTTPYTSIPSSTFADCDRLYNFNILDAVTQIGNAAFRNCLSMTEVKGMTSVKYIYQNAFAGCTSLTKFAMPDGCHTIGDYAFKNCTSLGLRGSGNKFYLPTDIVKKWTASSNIGMGTDPFVGWTANQEIIFRDANIEEVDQATGNITTKWGWVLKPDNKTSPSFYTCSDSGSSVVHFIHEQ